MKYTTSDVVQYDNFFDKEDWEEIQNKTGYGSNWCFGHTSYGRASRVSTLHTILED